MVQQYSKTGQLTSLPARSESFNSYRYLLNIADTDLIKEGTIWYLKAHNEALNLAAEFDITLAMSAGIIARLSPSISWERNIIAARNLLAGKDTIEGYPNNVNIAKKIAAGEFGTTDCEVSLSFPSSSRKIFSFYHNLQYPNTSHHITIDRWMIRASMCRENARQLPTDSKVSQRVYDELSSRVITFGLDNNIHPLQLQAMIWLSIREDW